MKLLEIENLKKSFEDLDVLHDISLGVEEGEVVAIIGPSGSGKSTLLRCCTGLEQADSGTIHYEGSYGLVFQNFNLFPHYSVLKNIMDAPVSVQKQSKKEAEKEARRLLEKMGLGDKADVYPCQLSGGQQQRVLLCRALCAAKKLLLLDEPVTGLDPVVTSEMYSLIANLNQEGITVIMVSHDIAAALKYASHILHIAQEQLFFGKKQDYLKSEAGKLFMPNGGTQNA